MAPDQVGYQRWKPIISAARPAVFNSHVLALDIAGLAQPLTERARKIREQFRRFAIEKSDHWHRRRLRTRHQLTTDRPACDAEIRRRLSARAYALLTTVPPFSTRPLVVSRAELAALIDEIDAL